MLTIIKRFTMILTAINIILNVKILNSQEILCSLPF